MSRGQSRGQPKRPAPVSGPGALSRRTDGGPGSESQPLRTPTGGDYGEAKALESQQRAAPLAAQGSARPSGGQPAGTAAPIPTGGVFGPTERPNESPTTGLATKGQMVAQDVNGFLNVLYSKFPHPSIAMLLRKGG